MKKLNLLLLLAGLMLALLSGVAMADEEMQCVFSFYINPGETLRPEYPDLAWMIDPMLAKDDFTITYSSINEKIRIAGDGTVTVAEDTNKGFYSGLWVTYTPKAANRGRTVRFTMHADVKKPITNVVTTFDSCVIALDQQVPFNAQIDHDAVPLMQIEGLDADILALEIHSNASDYYPNWSLTLLPRQCGKTQFDLVFHGGLRKTIEVEVVEPPTGVTMRSEEFTCYVGEPLDVGTQLIGGSGYNTLEIKVEWEYTVYQKSYFFPEDDTTFISDRTGAHYITMKTHNGHTARAVVNVRDRARAVRLEAAGIINAGVDSSAIRAYDAQGNLVEVDLEVTEGQEIASFVNGVLKSTAPGTIVVTAHNADGTTVSETFEIVPDPTEIILNETHLVMNVGDTFALEVGFDQGKTDYTVDLHSDDPAPPFGLYPARLEGQTIVAMAPGVSYVEVWAGQRYAACTVEVLDGDKAVSINVPELFGIGHTWQLQVTDKSGQVYPARFTAEKLTTDQALELTEDGHMTGLTRGNARIHAVLEDGRTLRYIQEVLAVPAWISHADMAVPENYTNVYIGSADSDVGLIRDLIVEIEDESIVSGGTGELKFHKTGTTKVTLTAVHGGAQTSFELTVLPADNRLYVVENGHLNEGGCTMQIAMGYEKQLPPVTDYYGNPVPVKWAVTYQVPGLGNPDDEAFTLSGDMAACTWASGMAQVTGTAASGETVQVQLSGYRLASEIVFRQPEGYVLEVGESVQVEVSPHPEQDLDRRVGEITWRVEGEDLIDLDMHAAGAAQIIVTGLKPGTATLHAKQISGNSITCTVKVIGQLPGDANYDGEVNRQDALLILQWEAGWSAPGNRALADINQDGRVDTEDALEILRSGDPQAAE